MGAKWSKKCASLAGKTASLLALVFTLGCSRTDASELREWSPADHDNQANPGAGQVDTEKRKAMMPDLTRQGIDDVVLITWKQNCIPCHGVIGRGDGPQGRSLHPPDFTNPGWQRVALDSEMARTIKKGRGPMPAFSQLPDSTVQGLVQLIRMLNPDRKPAPEEGEAEKGDTPPEAPSPEGRPPSPETQLSRAAPPKPAPVQDEPTAPTPRD